VFTAVHLNSEYKCIAASEETGASIFSVEGKDKINNQQTESGSFFDLENGSNI
jgi:hypothetical protein